MAWRSKQSFATAQQIHQESHDAFCGNRGYNPVRPDELDEFAQQKHFQRGLDRPGNRIITVHTAALRRICDTMDVLKCIGSGVRIGPGNNNDGAQTYV